MTLNELIEYLAHVESGLRADMAQIVDYTRIHTDHTDHGVRLDWCIAHLTGSFSDFYRDLERLQNELARSDAK